MKYTIKAKSPKGEVDHSYVMPEDVEWVAFKWEGSNQEVEAGVYADGSIKVNGEEVGRWK